MLAKLLPGAALGKKFGEFVESGTEQCRRRSITIRARTTSLAAFRGRFCGEAAAHVTASELTICRSE
jgi:hypothetical protein